MFVLRWRFFSGFFLINCNIFSDGFSYESSAITEWFDHGKNTSPMTNVEISNTELFENTKLKDQIDEYLKALDFDKFDVTPDLLN